MTSLARAGVSAFLEQFRSEWQAATGHAFLDAVADGSLELGRFDAWLAQDYLFVADLLAFQASLLARAPRAAQAVLAAGLVALEAELGWFEAHAMQRRLDLGVERNSATASYKVLLGGLESAPYAAAMTGLWAVERAYLDAWRGALPGAPPFREFVQHWTVPAFGEYVADLQRAADQALGASGPEAGARARTAFVDIARIELAFWDMAWVDRSA